MGKKRSGRDPSDITVVLDAAIWRRISSACLGWPAGKYDSEYTKGSVESAGVINKAVGSSSRDVAISLTSWKWLGVTCACCQEGEYAGRYLVEAVSSQLYPKTDEWKP